MSDYYVISTHNFWIPLNILVYSHVILMISSRKEYTRVKEAFYRHVIAFQYCSYQMLSKWYVRVDRKIIAKIFSI